MKIKYLILAHLFMGYTATYHPDIKSAKQEIIDAIIDTIQTDTPIDADDITRDCSFSTQIISVPYAITSSGFYCLGQDVNGVSGSTLVTINANNVFIDLNGKRMANGSVGFTGSNRRNIFIGNGTIADLTGGGVVLSNCNNVVLENLTCINNSTAMNTTGCNNFFAFGVTAYLHKASGIIITQSTNAIFESCLANGNGTQNGGSGFSLTGILNTIFFNCTANSNFTNGFFEQTSRNSLYQECTALSNGMHGFMQFGSRSSKYLDCFANSNSFSGFALTNNNSGATANRNHILKNCSATENTQQGFLLRGNHHSLKGCEAINNGQNGFWSSDTDHTMVQCNAKFNGVNGFLLHGDAHHVIRSISNYNSNGGILLGAPLSAELPISSNCLIIGNTLTKNTNFGIQNAGVSLDPLFPTPGQAQTNKVYSNIANSNGPNPLLFAPSNTNYILITNFIIQPNATQAMNYSANISD